MCGTGKPTAELARFAAPSIRWRLRFTGSSHTRQRCPNRFAFKKTCPFEFTRHGRPKAGTETRPAFLPSEVSQCDFKKGSTGFLASDRDSRWVGDEPAPSWR